MGPICHVDGRTQNDNPIGAGCRCATRELHFGYHASREVTHETKLNTHTKTAFLWPPLPHADGTPASQGRPPAAGALAPFTLDQGVS